ncbi:hypothetical protein ACIQVL_48685 [Streptomyces sp. NPDC090499]|uniref:hypothetical protein n=1 Tax=Streptomyces sp. NPDC090499 TaxID=3365965 RepID=UPI003810378F
MTTTSINPSKALGYAQEHAQKAWATFTQDRNLTERTTGWQTGISPDGSPTLSAQITGPDVAHALRLFTADSYVMLGQPGDQRPQFDYSVPGRTACVWRKYGVWIELWHPDSPETVSADTRAVRRRNLLSRASDRLPFTRRSKETTRS